MKTNGTNRKMVGTLGVLGAFLALAAGAADIRLDAKRPVRGFADDPGDDLRPGLRIAARVRFDDEPGNAGTRTICSRGGANELGAYILRVDNPKEGGKFSFFVNVDGSPEPRISLPVKPKPGVWHDVAAGWDGTNAWISVDGQRASRVRRPAGPTSVFPLETDRCVGRLLGTVRDLSVTVPPPPIPADTTLRAGFRLGCDVSFPKAPVGETTLVKKDNEYWLRYDARADGSGGAFNLFLFLNGGWEPRVSAACAVEAGRVYRVVGGWSGRAMTLAVDGVRGDPTPRVGRCVASSSRLVLGTKGRAQVTNFHLRNAPRPVAAFGMFRTRELMPTVGSPVTLRGSVANVGSAVGACVLTAKGRAGVQVTPARVELPGFAEGGERAFEWTVDPGTNAFAHIDFAVVRTDVPVGVSARTLCTATKRIVFMPTRAPDLSAKAWQPPIRPTRTYYIDADAGDDARDGLAPATAWRTFRRTAGLVLGPGERLLLKRGCVFREELCVTAAGAPGNWAEIGAYGEGMRPQIRRTRHINARCVYVPDAAYLAIRDLIVCDAGSGLMVGCQSPGSGHVLVERCLAHHIEGTYRFNSHGIPEWWDEPGPEGGSRSWGLAVTGGRPSHVVMRDCEMYQCSSGFTVRGTNTFVNRMFCHDNYAHNTSPHPYNCASRSWMTDCVFDASGWHASAGTMGVMLWGNDGYVIRGCHFLNQPDSGSPDQGGIDFEAQGENCLIDRCTFRNNAGAAIEVLGLRSPQTRNVWIRGCRFDRNNWAYKNGPAEIQVWGSPGTSAEVACSNGRIEGNGYVLVPGVPFYVNETRTTNDWILAGNRAFDFAEDLDVAFPYPNPPKVTACGEIWTDEAVAALSATVDDPKAAVEWEQIEGPAGVRFAAATAARTKATFPGPGDYRVNVKADNGTLWRTGRTAVHVLPKGARTFGAWDFARNLDAQGWRAEATGTGYAYLPGKNAFWDSETFPVQLVCGDYYVIAVKGSGTAALVSPADRDLGVAFSASCANAVRLKMQNATTSRAMRIWWQTDRAPTWSEARSVAFAVKPQDADDTVYTVPMPKIGGIKQLKLAFSADGTPVTGTVRLDYIWLGRLP